MKEDFSHFSRFFYPRNIAVIGVSPDKKNLGKNIVLNCLTFGFEGEILPVGLSGGVAFGQRIYRSLDEIDREIDLAVILTPARTIPGIIEQCGRKGIKHIVIESSGFSELGEEGQSLAKICVDVARRYGIRFIGPNCIGVTNLENGLVLPFMPLRTDLSPGPVSVMAQSGGVGLSYLGFLGDENMGINKFISIGNKLDVDENDLLGYLIQDPGTKIILAYLEGFTNGRRFVEIASRSEKPILVYKSNRFETSSRIAHSHTAALFSDDKLVDFALAQAGSIRINTLDDAIDYIKSQAFPPLRGNRLAVVSRSGGHAVIAADACGYYGFQLPRLPEDFLRKFESRFRAHVIRLQNPLDLGDLFDLEFYEHIVNEMLNREDVDGVLLVHAYRRGFEQESSRMLLKKVEQLVEKYGKPVATVIMTEAVEKDYLKKNLKIPIFSAPENAMRAFHLSYQWSSRKSRPLASQETGMVVDRAGAEPLLKNGQRRGHLLLGEALELLRCYGFPMPACGLARSETEALQFWNSVQGPVALKIHSPHISHKSDRGAVRLNLDSAADIRKALLELQSIGGPGTEVLVQSMSRKGREVILGGKQDPTFGPVVLFGLGGIFVEVLEDVVWHLAPIGFDAAMQMIQNTKGGKVLRGVRGEAPSDIEATAELLVRLSQLLADHPMIQEIDINPVMVFQSAGGAQALDARVIVRNAP
jgi:acetate---CoA ligase (ADP-forming)